MATNEFAEKAQQGVLVHRLAINNYIYKKFNGIVQHGPLKGFRINEEKNWGIDHVAKILGFYEAEILVDLIRVLKDKHFVDIGAADGYYAVGMVYAGIAKTALAFEMSDKGRSAIANAAAAHGLTDKVSILGEADGDFLKHVKTQLDQTVFLMDIEGFEYTLLDEENLRKLSKSVVFVELHENDPKDHDRFRKLLDAASKSFHMKIYRKIGRNPYAFNELDELTETEHWLACSEGRGKDPKWLGLTPFADAKL